MKTPQGFIGIPLLIAIVAVLLVAGGGTYVYLQNRSTPSPDTGFPVIDMGNQPQASTASKQGVPEVTIDTTYDSPVGPTISGTAVNIDRVSVELYVPEYRQTFVADSPDGIGYAQVVNGKWTAGFSAKIGKGPYTVTVYDPSNKKVLATGEVVLSSAPQTSTTPLNGASATIDQSSLITDSSTLIHLTGTVSGTQSISVQVGGSWGASTERGSITISNGRWSTETANDPGNSPFAPGTYKVTVIDNGSQKVLATGTLTVLATTSSFISQADLDAGYYYGAWKSGTPSTWKSDYGAGQTIWYNPAGNAIGYPTGNNVSVRGMSQYTDKDFGFSFSYPSTWHRMTVSETSSLWSPTDIVEDVSFESPDGYDIIRFIVLKLADLKPYANCITYSYNPGINLWEGIGALSSHGKEDCPQTATTTVAEFNTKVGNAFAFDPLLGQVNPATKFVLLPLANGSYGLEIETIGRGGPDSAFPIHAIVQKILDSVYIPQPGLNHGYSPG